MYKEVKTKDSSTSNMKSHLQVHHPLQYALVDNKPNKQLSTASKAPRPASGEVEVHAIGTPPSKKPAFRSSSQPLITAAFERHTKYAKESRRHKDITDKLTTMLARLMLPFSIVDEPEFREFCHELDPRYDVPGRKFFSNTAVPKKYNEVKAHVMSELKTTPSISCTTDGWSSNNMTPYLSLTAHFLTSDWQLRAYCLRTIYMPEAHTGENIASMLRTVLQEYELHISDVTTITTDSAANMKKACVELGAVRLPCFGHVLHNSINNSIKEEPEVVNMVKSCRAIVTAVTSSYKQRANLKKHQKEAGLKVKNLVGEVSTRWGSKYSMVEAIYTNKQAIQSLLMNDRKLAKLNPSWDELCIMEMFVRCLQPLSVLTDAMSTELSVSVSKLYPLLLHIKSICTSPVDIADLSPEILTMAERLLANIWSYIKQRYEDDEELMKLLKLCAFLDPRLQTSAEDTRNSVVVEAVALECIELGEGEQSQSQPEASISSQPERQPSKDSGQSSSSSLMDLLMTATQQINNDQSDTDADSRAVKEVEYYSQISRSMISATEDLHQWWGSKGAQFPMMQRVARKYLTVNATSTSSERLFSFAGNIVSKKRSCLKPEKVDMLTCLAYNLRHLNK